MIEEPEIHSFEAPEPDVEDTEDGGAILKLSPDEPDSEEESEFYKNLVEDLEEDELELMCSNLLEDINRDRKSRELRDKQYAEAIKRTGLGDEAPGGADFEGASKAVHPMLTQACVDFASRTIKELFPPNGPVKTFIPGNSPTAERVDKAERKKNYMNWQFMVQMPEFRTELEQLLTQLPLGGSQYLRLVYDSTKQRPVPTSVPIDDMYLPYSATNFYSAGRRTFAEHITQQEFDIRVKSGMYMAEKEVPAGMTPEQTDPAKATDKIEGRDSASDSNNADGLRTVYEVSMMSEIEDEYGLAPYLFYVDSVSHRILGIIRNWEESDETKDTLHWIAEFQFVPWRGAYSIGLGQMIGSLSGGATGALRALLDSAHINNFPGLLKLKGANFSGQSDSVSATGVTEVEGGVAADDIRKLLMPMPFNPPSPVLFQLLGFLVDAGQGVVRTTFDNLSDQNPNMPVGTTLALIEEGMKVMSSIHLRLYHSMAYVFRILHRINRLYLTDEQVMDEVGDFLAYSKDFELPLDVIPIADPQVFSDVQRMAQLQIVADRAMQMPQLYDLRKVEQRLLERTKIPNPEELLLPVEEPEEQNAVNENAAMVMGRPVIAFPEQDHLAHLQVHLDFLTNPLFGQNVIIAPTYIGACLDHIKEHMTMWYVTEMVDQLKAASQFSDADMKQVMQHTDHETRKELDKTLASLSPAVNEMSQSTFAQIPEIIQQSMTLLQQVQPPPTVPPDPNAMAMVEQKREADTARIQQREASDQRLLQQREQSEQRLLMQKEQSEQRKVQLEVQTMAQKQQHEKEMKFMELSAEEKFLYLQQAREEQQASLELVARLEELQLKEQAEDRRTEKELQSRERINTQDNETAMTIAAAELATDQKTGLETGGGINPGS
jgi:hypothetical protein